MRFYHVILTSLILFGTALTAADKKIGRVVSLGVYVLRIDSFDIKSGEARLDFWVWARYRGTSRPLLQTLELANGFMEPAGKLVVEEKNGIYCESQRYRANVSCRIDIEKFPFDSQTIRLAFEDNEATVDLQTFKADIANSKLDQSCLLNEWDIQSLKISQTEHAYPTTFGSPKADPDIPSVYSQITVDIQLRRSGSILQKIFKYFWAIFISVMVGAAALWIKVTDLDARFGMAVGALFANIGCAFIISDKLPESFSITYAELVSYTSLGLILIFLVESIVSLALFNHSRETASRWLDRCVSISCVCIYIVLLWQMILTEIISQPSHKNLRF